MFKCNSVTLDSTYASYIPFERVICPTNCNGSSWIIHTTLPYNIDPGSRLRIRTNELCPSNVTSGSYIIQEDPSICDLGIQLTYTTNMDTAGRYYFMMHNYGTSTVVLSQNMVLGKILIFTCTCSDK